MLDAYQLGVLSNSVATLSKQAQLSKRAAPLSDFVNKILSRALSSNRLPAGAAAPKALPKPAIQLPGGEAEASASRRLGSQVIQTPHGAPAESASRRMGPEVIQTPHAAPKPMPLALKAEQATGPSPAVSPESPLNPESPAGAGSVQAPGAPLSPEEALKKKLTEQYGSPMFGGALNWTGDQVKKMLWHLHPGLGMAVHGWNPEHTAIGAGLGLYGMKRMFLDKDPEDYQMDAMRRMYGGMGGLGGMPHFGYY